MFPRRANKSRIKLRAGGKGGSNPIRKSREEAKKAEKEAKEEEAKKP